MISTFENDNDEKMLNPLIDQNEMKEKHAG